MRDGFTSLCETGLNIFLIRYKSKLEEAYEAHSKRRYDASSDRERAPQRQRHGVLSRAAVTPWPPA